LITDGQAYWPKDESTELIHQTVGGLLVQRALEIGDQLAVVGVRHGTGEEARLTYSELLAEATRVAGALLELAEPGQLVGLWAPNVLEWPIIEFGAALAGVVLVALNPALRPGELEYALTHSRCGVLLHADSYRGVDMHAVVSEVAARCPDLRTTVCLDVVASWEPSAFALPAVSCRDNFMLQYTSGTTGLPKGVVLRHGSVVNCAKLTMEAVAAHAGAVALNPLPMFHTAGCIIGTLGPLWLGGAVVLVDQFAPQPVLEQLVREQVQVLFFVPTILSALLQTQASRGTPPPRLSCVMGGASNVPPSMIEQAESVFGARVHNLYGQTELSPVLTAIRQGDSREDILRTIGRPLPQVECKVIDPETGETVPLGVSGEICARGYQVLVEYLHDPEATDRAVDSDGWLHTGDLGSMDARGVITLSGRLKDLIIRGGENISPAEIENVLTEHPAVLGAAVVGLPDEHWGEVIAAVVQLDPALAVDPDRTSLAAHCKDRLAPFKVPASYFVIGQLPLTPTGKIQKFLLRDAAQRDELTSL